MFFVSAYEHSDKAGKMTIDLILPARKEGTSGTFAGCCVGSQDPGHKSKQ